MYFPLIITTNLLLQTGLYLFSTGSFPFMLSHTFEYLFRVYVLGLFLPMILVIKNKLDFSNNNNILNLISWYLVILTGHFNIYDQHFEKEYGFYPSNLLTLFIFFLVVLKNFTSQIKLGKKEKYENQHFHYTNYVSDEEEKTVSSEEELPRKRQPSLYEDDINI